MVVEDVKATAAATAALLGSKISGAVPISPSSTDDWPSTGVRYELVFSARLPPLSLSSFFVSTAWALDGAVGGDCARESADPTLAAEVSTAVIVVGVGGGGGAAGAGGAASAGAPPIVARAAAAAEPLILENACLRAEVDPYTGLLLGVTAKVTEGDGSAVRFDFAQTVGAYHTQQSGAYIFRPVGETETLGVATTVTLSGGDGALAQSVRAIASSWTQTTTLTDTLGWRRGSAPTGALLSSACADPLQPDAGIDVSMTLTASVNAEVVTSFATSLDATPYFGDTTNLRDLLGGGTVDPSEDDSLSINATCVPFGWWTLDGLSLARRTLARVGLPANERQKHFYPMNAGVRLSGAARSGGAAWVTILGAAPYGVYAEKSAPPAVTPAAAVGSRLEIMMHRHLANDDGRGLSAGVNDATRTAPSLRILVGAAGAPPGVGESGRDSLGAYDATCRVRLPGARGLHRDWLWTWGAASSAHIAPPIMLHADLAAWPVDANAVGTNLARGLAVDGLARAAPPLDASAPVGASKHIVLAEASSLTRATWLGLFSPNFHGLGGSGLPAHVSLATLAVRDAVSDDVTLRLHNLGGGRAVVDVGTLLGGHRAARSLTSLRARGATLTRSESEAVAARTRSAEISSASVGETTMTGPAALAAVPLLASFRLPPADVFAAVTFVRGGAGGAARNAPAPAADIARQNTNEDGVFISDAAVEKAPAAAPAVPAAPAKGLGGKNWVPPPFTIGRKLLEDAPAASRYTVTVDAWAIRSFLATLSPAGRIAAGAESRALNGGLSATRTSARILSPGARLDALLTLIDTLRLAPRARSEMREAAAEGAITAEQEATLLSLAVAAELGTAATSTLDELLVKLLADARTAAAEQEAAGAAAPAAPVPAAANKVAPESAAAWVAAARRQAARESLAAKRRSAAAAAEAAPATKTSEVEDEDEEDDADEVTGVPPPASNDALSFRPRAAAVLGEPSGVLPDIGGGGLNAAMATSTAPNTRPIRAFVVTATLWLSGVGSILFFLFFCGRRGSAAARCCCCGPQRGAGVTSALRRGIGSARGKASVLPMSASSPVRAPLPPVTIRGTPLPPVIETPETEDHAYESSSSHTAIVFEQRAERAPANAFALAPASAPAPKKKGGIFFNKKGGGSSKGGVKNN